MPDQARARRVLPWLLLAGAVTLLDQWTKALVVAHLSDGGAIAYNPIFSLILAYNPGAAFSFLAGAGGWQRMLFIAIALVAVIAITALLWRAREDSLFYASLAFILGGALGNLLDRIRIGEVVDFLLFHYQAWAFPAFNLADSAITLGAALLIYDSLRGRTDERRDDEQRAHEHRAGAVGRDAPSGTPDSSNLSER